LAAVLSFRPVRGPGRVERLVPPDAPNCIRGRDE